MNKNSEINRLQPVIITIFGATGDLAKKKLFPSLFELFKNDYLNEKFYIVGLSRKDWSDQDFQDYVSDLYKEKVDTYDKITMSDFLSHFNFVSGDIENIATYEKLKEKLGEIDKKENTCINKVFYLAVTPAHYEKTLQNISESGLTIPCSHIESKENTEWTRVFIEKPFGNNLNEAEKLEELLASLFDESQIFRIDHYLGKESIQNILSFRFTNSIFEPLWNKDNIEKIEITLLEDNIVGSRGLYYDNVGALRDVGQSHILQILALTMMEKPSHLANKEVQIARENVLEKLIYVHNDTSLTRAQYKNYHSEPGVEESSSTETYFKVRVFLENERFSGVPIILESGKGFSKSKGEIKVYFKPTHSSLYELDNKEIKIHQNILTLKIQPENSVSLNIFMKEPGFEYIVTPIELKLNGHENKYIPSPHARVFYDGLSGDQSLFVSTKEIKEEWRIVDKIINHYDKTDLGHYPIGIEEL